LFLKKTTRFTEDDLDSIITACLKRDSKAEVTLIKMFFGYAKSISMRYASSAQEAEEIINDGFLKVFDNLSKYNHTRPFRAWLRAIIINTAIDYYRKRQKYANHADVDDMEIISYSEDVISKISAEEILSLIQRLSPAYRMVFTLYVIDGYTHREIADMLGIKEGTSKSNLQDARMKLQIMIKNISPHIYLDYGLKPTKLNEN
jgi:RNA polymerase sigma-70 factor (ECF subfamily)